MDATRAVAGGMAPVNAPRASQHSGNPGDLLACQSAATSLLLEVRASGMQLGISGPGKGAAPFACSSGGCQPAECPGEAVVIGHVVTPDGGRYGFGMLPALLVRV